MENVVAKTPRYFTKRHQTYVIRRPVPKAIQGIIGQREITRSLGTRDKKEAELRYYEKMAPIQRMFSEAEAQVDTCTWVHLDDFDPIDAAKGWLDQKLQFLHENDLQQFAAGERERRIDELRYELSFFKGGVFEQYASNLQMTADAILIQAGYPRVAVNRTLSRRWWTQYNLANVDKSDSKYHQFVELIRKALVQLLETELKLLGAGVASTPTSLPVLACPVAQKTAVKAQGPSVSELIEEFLDIQDKQRKFRDPKTLMDKKSAYRFLTETVGEDFSIKNLSCTDFLRIQKLVDKYPVNARKLKGSRGLSVKELVKLGEQNNARIISVTTKNKIISRLTELMQYAEEVGYIERNFCKRLRFGQSDSEKSKNEKEQFSEKQLVQMFQSKEFQSDYRGSKTIRWTTLLALFHGFRMEEILQLTSDDFIQDDKSGKFYFNIHDEGDNRLKNKNAKRRVPVHSDVMRVGFGAVVQAACKTKDKRLFPDTKRAQGVDTSYRKNFTRKYSRYLKHHDIYTRLTTFHSLRRNFTVTSENAKVSDNVRNVICGWKLSGGQNGTYLKNRDYEIGLLSDEIEKVSYPFLDQFIDKLSAYKD